MLLEAVIVAPEVVSRIQEAQRVSGLQPSIPWEAHLIFFVGAGAIVLGYYFQNLLSKREKAADVRDKIAATMLKAAEEGVDPVVPAKLAQGLRELHKHIDYDHRELRAACIPTFGDDANEARMREAAARRCIPADEMLDRIVAAMRKARAAKHKGKAKRRDVAPKLVNAQLRLTLWQARARRAANKVKKYMRQVRYYEGKQAAAGGGK